MKNPEHKFAAIFTFVTAFLVYMITISPTVSFWDCGEFIASAVTLGIPHPPGAPLYLIVSKFLSLMPIGGDLAFRVNIVSALSSALTVLFLYLIAVRLIKEFIKDDGSIDSKMSIYFSAVIGALTFAFTDTFWFSAVEAEVYAFSMLGMSAVFWLTLKWMDSYKELNSLRYIILIAYLVGLSIGVHLLTLLVIPSLLLLVLFYDKKILRNFNLLTVAAAIAFIGTTTYLMIYIRSNLGPVINENDPSTLERFWSYWNREQYGQVSMFSVIFDRVAPLWTYQIKKMFLRYFAWNFMGQGTTLGADKYIVETFSPNGLFYMPFTLGIIGVWYHFKKDWKRALSLLTLFIITSVILVIYLNQPDPQPRERDYVYVGCFFAFSIWIGLGVTALFEFTRKKFGKNENTKTLAFGIVAGLAIVMGPFIEFRHNYDSHDRTGDYMAWDFPYNMLESVEENGILFTNGDNDTFPLWYVQEVEGIRKDVSIVNLSLLNTNWYIKQLKYGLNPVSISIPDATIDVIQPQLWNEQKVNFNIPAEVYNENIKDIHPSYNLTEKTEVTQISPLVKPTIAAGQGIRVQDMLILNIIAANKWKRPVFFAMTIPTSNLAGLTPNLSLRGMAFKLVPFSGDLMATEKISDNLFNKFQYRGLNDPDVYLNNQKRDLIQNMRISYYRLASFYHQRRMYPELLEVLNKLDEKIPEKVVPQNNIGLAAQFAQMYFDAGDTTQAAIRFDDLLNRKDVGTSMKLDLASIFVVNLHKVQKGIEIAKNILALEPDNPNAISRLLAFYERSGEYDEAIKYLDDWIRIKPEDAGAKGLRTKFEDLIAKADTAQSK